MSPWRRLGWRAALVVALLICQEVGARLLGARDPIAIALGLAAVAGPGALAQLVGLGLGVALLLCLRVFLYFVVPPWLALGLLRALWPPD